MDVLFQLLRTGISFNLGLREKNENPDEDNFRENVLELIFGPTFSKMADLVIYDKIHKGFYTFPKES